MVFSIDFDGHCSGCHLNDGPGTLATIGSQLHLLIYVGIWIYSFIHREVFIWTINTVASLLLGLIHVFHKIHILGKQPPCLACVAAIYDRYYELEGSAVPSAPVALVCFYMLVIYACPLELGSAYRYDGGSRKHLQRHRRKHRCLEEGNDDDDDDRHHHHRRRHPNPNPNHAPSASELIAWDHVSHLDVLIIPCWSAAARLYVGLTTPVGVVAGAIVGGAAVLLLFALVRSNWFRKFVGYIVHAEPLSICGLCIGPIPGIATVLRFLGFETRLLDIMWNNLDADDNDNNISVE